MIDQLAGPLHAQLLLARDGVWLFRFARPLDATSVVFKSSPTEPAWAAQTATGTPLLDGPPFDWAMTLTSAKPGYILYGTEWNLLPGTYQTTLTMASDITTEVEVWDSATNTLLSRQTVPPTNGHVAIQSGSGLPRPVIKSPTRAGVPFSFQPGPSPGGRPNRDPGLGQGQRRSQALQRGGTALPTVRVNADPPGVHPSIRCIDQLVMINWPFTTPAVISMR